MKKYMWHWKQLIKWNIQDMIKQKYQMLSNFWFNFKLIYTTIK